MAKTLFLAGASGAIGRRLIPLLLREGWRVTGMTRSAARAEALRGMGIDAVVGDAFDADGIGLAVRNAAPDAVIHQMTDLPRNMADLDDTALARNARLRETGTANLVRGAIMAGARRLIVQSIAFAYAPGTAIPHKETDPLNGQLREPGAAARGVVSLEEQVNASPLESVILRYGRLYGPGTGSEAPWGPAPVHVDAAAFAAALAAASSATGTFNVAEDDGQVDSSRACAVLGWDPAFRLDAIERI